MKRLRYFLRRYFPDILTTAAAVVVAGVAYRYTNDPRITFLSAAVITLAAAFVILYFRIKERVFYYASLTDRRQGGDWVGYGTFEYSRMDRCFRITGSDSGFLFTRTLTWSDYELRFRFKILASCLGVIVRAVNLSNLAMLQITRTGIRPHIRVNGAWHWWEAAAVGLEFTKPLDFNEWYDCTVKCDQDGVRAWIWSKKTLQCDKAWKIPRGQVNFALQDESLAGDSPYEGVKSIPFSITLEYGTVGFRNDAAEEALVRDLLIEKIQG